MLTKKLKEGENKVSALKIENKKLKDNYDFLEKTYANVVNSPNIITTNIWGNNIAEAWTVITYMMFL